MSITKIVTHKNITFDSFVSVCLLKYLYPNAKIEYLSSSVVPIEYLREPEIALINVGENFNPDLNNFDFPYDIFPPKTEISSTYYIVKKFFPNLDSKKQNMIICLNLLTSLERELFEFFYFIPKNEKYRLHSILKVKIDEKVSNIVSELLFRDYPIDCEEMLSQFINDLYQEFVNLNLISNNDVKEIYINDYNEKVSKIKELKLTFKGYVFRVLISYESLAYFITDLLERVGKNIDIYIERNLRNPENTTIIFEGLYNKTNLLKDAILSNLKVKYELHYKYIVEQDIEKVENVILSLNEKMTIQDLSDYNHFEFFFEKYKNYKKIVTSYPFASFSDFLHISLAKHFNPHLSIEYIPLDSEIPEEYKNDKETIIVIDKREIEHKILNKTMLDEILKLKIDDTISEIVFYLHTQNYNLETMLSKLYELLVKNQEYEDLVLTIN